MQVHSEEHGEGGKEEPKYHSSRIEAFNCVLGSQSLKINHKMPPPYQQALWKGCTKKVLTESNRQIQASGVGQTSTELFGHVHRLHAWRQKRDASKEKHLIPPVKYGGESLTLWGRFALVNINGIMNSTKYQDILAKNLVASARKLRLGRRWTFQQDKDPKRTSKSAQKWFRENKISFAIAISVPGLRPYHKHVV